MASEHSSCTAHYFECDATVVKPNLQCTLHCACTVTFALVKPGEMMASCMLHTLHATERMSNVPFSSKSDAYCMLMGANANNRDQHVGLGTGAIRPCSKTCCTSHLAQQEQYVSLGHIQHSAGII